jgi:hypothetical protein
MIHFDKGFQKTLDIAEHSPQGGTTPGVDKNSDFGAIGLIRDFCVSMAHILCHQHHAKYITPRLTLSSSLPSWIIKYRLLAVMVILSFREIWPQLCSHKPYQKLPSA